MRFHPGTQILAWCLLVAALQMMTHGALVAVAGAVLVSALVFSRIKLFQLVRRTRWIMLSLLAIYAYSTPGNPLAEALGAASPTREGLSDGAVQLARLLAALASLALVLDRLPREQLIAGLYALLGPLQWLGVPRDRVAVRLALTLHYAEAAVFRGAHDWREALHGLFGGALGDASAEGQSDAARLSGQPTGVFELPVGRFSAGDMLLLGSAVFILWLALA